MVTLGSIEISPPFPFLSVNAMIEIGEFFLEISPVMVIFPQRDTIVRFSGDEVVKSLSERLTSPVITLYATSL